MLRGVCILLLLITPAAAEDDVAAMPWPRIVRDFPAGDSVRFETPDYVISRRVPTDPAIRREGGSGGPMMDIKLRHKKSGRVYDVGGQTVGERLLEDYDGHPQIEIWGRGGGGSWSRCLYRYVRRQYRCARIDEFTESESRANDKSRTATLPHSKDVLYFSETRIPDDA
jgi:hypothetical protein